MGRASVNEVKNLVVDDELQNVKLLQRLLSAQGYEVLTANNGEDALKKVMGNKIDLILLDVMMPGINGFEVTRRLRAYPETRVIPIVLLTALQATEDRIKGIDAGCDDFISKPFNTVEVLSRVKMLLEMNFYRSQLDEKEKFESLLNQIEDGIVVLDKELKIIKFNKPAGDLLYLDPSNQALDFFKHIQKYFKIHYVGDLASDLRMCTVTFDIEREETDKMKALVLEVKSSIIRNPLGEISSIVLSVRNVTDLRKEEWMKQNFLSLISHKLRTPLTVICSFAEVLKGGAVGPLNEKQEKIFNSIFENAEKLNTLVDKLLKFMMVNAEHLDLPKEVINLSSYLSTVIEPIVKSTKNKKVNINIRCEDKGLKIQMNRIYFDLIITNLVENAIKFNDKNIAEITITARGVSEGVQISVADNGPGIPPEGKNKIFDKFYQVEKYFTGNVEGAGLGLAATKQFVESHGGKIKVESVLGQGSEFIIILP